MTPVQAVVIDTNIVLDLFVFNDPATATLLSGLNEGTLFWLATQPMRDELTRVLAYPQILPRLRYYQLTSADVLARFDPLAHLVDIALKASVTCKDADDQKFIDLAVAHRAILLSKDKAILCMKNRLRPLGVELHLPSA